MAKLSSHCRNQILADHAASGAPAKGSATFGQFVEHQAALRGVSPATVYRTLAGQHGRRERRGPEREEAPARALAVALALKAQLGLSTPHAADILEANGFEGRPSASTINRALRREVHLGARKLEKMTLPTGEVKAPDCIRLQAKVSNQVWQLDFTVAAQYYLDAGGAFEEYSPLTHGGNKAEKDRVKLWLYAVVDDHSGARFAWFYPGLSSTYAVDFLVRAMARKGPELLSDQPGAPQWLRVPGIAPPPGEDLREWLRPERLPLCGVPEKIYTDNAQIRKSERTLFKQALTHRLGVEIEHHLPGHSWAKGKSEVSFHILAEFQKVTRAGRFGSLYEANRAMCDHLLKINALHGRSAAWLSGIGRLRLLDRPDLVRRLFLKSINVYIDNQVSFSHDGRRVYLPREERFRRLVDERVDVIIPANYEDGDEVAVVVDGREEWIAPAAPIVVDTGKEYHGLPKLDQQRLVEQALAVDLSDLKLTGIYHELPRYRQEHAVPVGESYRPEALQPARGAPRGLVHACRRFVEEGLFHAEVAPEEAAWLRGALFAGREEAWDAEIEDLIRSVKSGQYNVGDNVAVFR